jgi:ubiquitin domain-containing protein
MKKIVHLFVLLSFLSTGLTATASATVNNAKSVISEEPEPHPNTIYVKLKLNGNTVYLSVLVFPTDLVGDVKSSVSEITGIPAGSFTLYFNGQALDEDLTLAYYGIGAGATLNAY